MKNLFLSLTVFGLLAGCAGMQPVKEIVPVPDFTAAEALHQANVGIFSCNENAQEPEGVIIPFIAEYKDYSRYFISYMTTDNILFLTEHSSNGELVRLWIDYEADKIAEESWGNGERDLKQMKFCDELTRIRELKKKKN
jgi:hypothetical protein